MKVGELICEHSGQWLICISMQYYVHVYLHDGSYRKEKVLEFQSLSGKVLAFNSMPCTGNCTFALKIP